MAENMALYLAIVYIQSTKDVARVARHDRERVRVPGAAARFSPACQHGRTLHDTPSRFCTSLLHGIAAATVGLLTTTTNQQPCSQAQELEEWLQTSESKHTGMTREGATEAVGHQSGRC